MKFKLYTAGDFYNEAKSKALETLGFTFTEDNSERWGLQYMKDMSENVEIEFNTLEELIEFTRKWGTCVVSKGAITIYDDYME